MTYFKTKDTVRECLTSKPKTRDSDNALLAHVIIAMEKRPGELTAMQLLENLVSGKYGQIESMTRARRKWQEKFEDLRGEKWKERHGFIIR